MAYNIGAIFSEDDQYRVEIWPRVLSLGKKRRFLLDAERTTSGLPYQSYLWRKLGASKPSSQHKRFWSHAIPRASGAEGARDIWIAAHSAWYTFRPRQEPWDERLFGNHSFPEKFEDMNGDVWKPLAARSTKEPATKFRFRVLLAHPYGAEARCVLRNQASIASEQGRNARDDFYRTLRALMLISTWTKRHQPSIERFDVRVMNPCYRIMTNSLYAVGDHLLFVPLAYSGLTDQGFAVWHRRDSLYGRYLEFIKSHFNDNESICPLTDSSVKFRSARTVELDKLPRKSTDLKTFRETVEVAFSWLREAATREHYQQGAGSEDPGTFHSSWKI